MPSPSRSTLGRPCLRCGTVTPGRSVCPPCLALADVTRNARRAAAGNAYNAAWRRLSAKARRLQPWCSACGTDQNLTGDHRIPLAAGGKRTGLRLADIDVLCAPCNARKGGRVDATS